MARHPAEIQADIALTRRLVEARLDRLSRAGPGRGWVPWALLAGGLAAGVLLSRLPVRRLTVAAARAVRAGAAVAGAVAAVDRALARRRRRRPAA